MQQMQLSMGRTLTVPKNVSQLQNPKVGRAIQNLNGETFGRLLVIGFCGVIPSGSNHLPVWLTRCVCGNFKILLAQSLLSKKAQSCGCRQKETVQRTATTHGGWDSPAYRSYYHALSRCNNPNDPRYKDYGGRGIKFLFNSFDEFLAEVGHKPMSQHSIDRIDNDGHYEQGNVRWSTYVEQSHNRQNTIFLTINGITKSTSEWAESSLVPINRIYDRLKIQQRYWCHKCAVFNKLRMYCTHEKNETVYEAVPDQSRLF